MNRKAIIKTIIGGVIFLVLLSVILTFLGKYLLPYEHFVDRQQCMYYNFPKDTVDVLCTGNSAFRQGFSPNTLWHEYGIVAYSRVDSRQSPELTYFEVKDTLERHHPKLVIMGVPRLFQEYDYVENEPLLRRSMDYKKLTFQKIKTAAALSSHTDIKETVSYIFPLIRYHSRWNEVTREEAEEADIKDRDIWRGEFRVNQLKVLQPWSFYDSDKEVPEYSKKAIKWYEKTLELCNRKGVKVLIVTMPEVTNTVGMNIGTQEFADKYGADYLDFTTDELIKETGIKFDEDFQGGHHLAITGARKVSKYIGEYIVKKYGIPQWECSDELTKMLDEDYEAYTEEYESSVKKLQKQMKEGPDETDSAENCG
ncbi:MAG: hypothetical protein IKF07_03185 [Eubacterium sp.]|nr:hypothetical protein [Eubacterium sp.]